MLDLPGHGYNNKHAERTMAAAHLTSVLKVTTHSQAYGKVWLDLGTKTVWLGF